MRKKLVVSSKTQRGAPAEETNTVEATEQIEKLKKLIKKQQANGEKEQPIAIVKSKSLVRGKAKSERGGSANIAKNENSASVVEDAINASVSVRDLKAASPKKKGMAKCTSVSQASTANSSMGRTQSKWLTSLTR